MYAPSEADFEAVLVDVRSRLNLSDPDFQALRRHVTFQVSGDQLMFDLLGIISFGPDLGWDDQESVDGLLWSLTDRLTDVVSEIRDRDQWP